MHNAASILTGLVLFLVVVTFPLWYNAMAGEASAPPELVYPASEKQCVMATDYMTGFHMDVLNQWRDEVVRENVRVFVSEDGRKFNKSLTHTCLDCHSNKSEFCDRCHDYAGVDPYCWDCHVNPEEVGP